MHHDERVDALGDDGLPRLHAGLCRPARRRPHRTSAATRVCGPFRRKPFPALGELDVFAFAAAGFLADTFVDLRIGRIKAALNLLTRFMANSGPQSEAHAENLLVPERARIP